MKRGDNMLTKPVDVAMHIPGAGIDYTAKICCRFLDTTTIDYTIASIRQHDGSKTVLITDDDMFWGLQGKIRRNIDGNSSMEGKLRELVKAEHEKYCGPLNY